MKKILINFAHPAKSKSKINKSLLAAIEGLEGVTINDLYATYPDYLVDTKREQGLCESHDVIIFQHPFYWYSVPSLIREWQDLVLEHGWAYGSKAHALEGTYFMHALTAGGDNSTYQKDGYNRYTINELLAPYEAAAKLCKMNWLPPFAVFGVHRGLSEDKVTQHSEDYRRMIIALRDENVDFDKAKKQSCCNDDMNLISKKA